MGTRVFGKERHAIDAVVTMLILTTIILISGCLLDKSYTGAPNNQILRTSAQTETVQRTTIEKISKELDMLNSKGWGALAAELKRPRATTLLWYHLKKTFELEPKVVFGNPNKLNTSLAILVKKCGNSTFPRIRIKDVDYYIIDPMTPAIVGEFNYGYMYDDSGSIPRGWFIDFRLNTQDISIVEQWIKETGVNLKYTDFPGK